MRLSEPIVMGDIFFMYCRVESASNIPEKPKINELTNEKVKLNRRSAEKNEFNTGHCLFQDFSFEEIVAVASPSQETRHCNVIRFLRKKKIVIIN